MDQKMKKLLQHILILLSLILVCNFSFSNNSKNQNTKAGTDTVQFNRKDKRNFNTALDFIYNEEYQQALPLFKKLLKKDPDNCNFNFFTGVCLFNLKAPKFTIKLYFDKAVRKTVIDFEDDINERRSPVFAYYYQAQLLMLDNKFDEAFDKLMKFESLIPSSNTKLLHDVIRMIEICNNAKILIANPLKGLVIEPFDALNTTYYDYGAQLSSDGNTIFFSSKRKGNLGEIGTDGQYKSDIYYIQKENGKWSDAIPFKIVNSEANDNFCCLSADGKTLLFSSDRENDLYDIYACTKSINNEWSPPVKLGNTINSKGNETNAWLTQDGKTLYFVSDKKGGYGGRDIYKSEKLDDGTWGKSVNLGNTINSSYDEKSPFVTADGKNLYFSSKGHKTMGGFDIFYSKLENNKWTEPVNLGSPINTSYDDQYFTISNDGKTILYSSAKKGLDGTTDIFTIQNFNIDSTKKIADLLNKNISTDTIIHENKAIAGKDTVYTVQIGAGKNLKISAYNVLYGVKECTGKDGLKRYIIGEFSSRAEAEALRQEMIRLGFGDAWIPSIDENRLDCE